MSMDARFVGKYELKEVLGRGGMAEVWQAFDTQLRREVAIKFLHPDLQNDSNFVARFEREAQAIASLHHPNIVQIYDIHISRPAESKNTLCYMVMDYVVGQTLSGYLRNTSRVGKFPPTTDIVHLFGSMGNAVDYAHSKGIIHRDIKPANILLDLRSAKGGAGEQSPMGEPILSDFGIVKMLGTSSNTLGNWWLGTPIYTSPEQVTGHAGSELSDIYSLGVILYEMCTGVPPFQGEDTHAIMMQHVNALPIAPALINPNIPPALSAVILRCLAKEPTTRYSSASALASAVAAAFNGTTPLDLVKTKSSGSSLQPLPFHLAPHLTPAITPFPIAIPTVHPPVGALATPQYMGTASTKSTHAYPISVPPSGPPLAPQSRKRPSLKLILPVVALLFVLLGGGLAMLLLFMSKNTTNAVTPNPIVDHAFFVSSGQISEHSNQGINDELEVDLQHMRDPAFGKSYYAWLEADRGNNMVAPIFLGALPLKNGEVHYLYPGDQAHTNLLATMSRFLITEEDASKAPTIPSPDTGTWRYEAELPQAGVSTNNTTRMAGMSDLSVLTHIRHLLVEAPELKQVGLPGGFDIWFFRNTQKILEWAGGARDDWQTQSADLMHRHLVRILDYLDGLAMVQKDAPNEPVLVSRQLAQVGLLDLSQHQFPSYVYMIDFHLNAMIQATDLTPGQRQLAAQIDNDMKNAKSWFDKVHQDATQLVKLPNSQLLQPATLALLDDMATQALSAFVGRIDPSTGQVQGGVLQVHYDSQHLADMAVHPYHP